MKRILLIIAFFILAGSVSAAQIFFDGFESGGLGGWSLTHAAGAVDWAASTSSPYQGSYHAFGRPMDTDDPACTMERTISTLGYTTINFSYYRKLNLGTSLHTFRAKWYDGLAWTSVEDLTGTIADSSYALKSFLLPSSAADNANFAIKFECTEGTTTKDCNIDNINITGVVPDTTPPQFSNYMENPANSSSYLQNQFYQFNVTITETNLNKVWLEWGGVNYTNGNIISAGNVYSFNRTNLAAGTYSYRWWANDTNGNLNSSGMRYYLVSKAEGEITLLLNSQNNNLTIFYPQQSNVTASSLYSPVTIYLNGEDKTSENGLNVTRNSGYYNVTAVSSGDENHSSLSITKWLNITLDTIPPSITIVLPESKTYGYNASLPINYSVSDENGISSCWYSLDGSSNITLANCQNSSFNTSEGAHILYLYSNDTRGNIASSSRSFSVNTRIAVSLISPLDNSWLNYNNVKLNYSVITSTSIKNCSLWINSGTWHLNQTNASSINLSGGVNSFSLELVGDGSYMWNVLCTDTYNAFAQDNYTLNIDTIKPSLAISYPSDNSVFMQNVSIQLNFSVSDANLQSCWYNLGGGNISIANCQNISFGFMNGNYNLTLYSNDSAGNLNSSKVYNITIEHDSLAPSLTLSEPAGAKTNRNGIPLTFSASDNVDSLSDLSCWYNVAYTSTGGNVSGLERVSIADCSSTSFNVPSDADYKIVLNVGDRTGNSNKSSSSFSVSTSSTGGSTGGDSGGGGGGGGGSSGNYTIKKKYNLEFGAVSSLILNPGESKKISLNVKNTGINFLNDCRISGNGSNSAWISSSENKDLSSGQIVEFIFTVNAPETMEEGSNAVEIELKCAEFSSSTTINVERIKKKLEIEILSVKREGRQLRVDYSISEFSNQEQDVNIEIVLLDGSKRVGELKETKKIHANEVLRLSSLIDASDELDKMTLLINADSGIASTFLQEEILLGKSRIGGMSVFANFTKTTNSMIFGVIVLFAAASYFIIRRIMKFRKMAGFHKAREKNYKKLSEIRGYEKVG